MVCAGLGVSRLLTLPSLGQVPEGVDWAAVVKNSMDRYSVEIAGGLGPTAGKVWRVGIMVRASFSWLAVRCPVVPA